MRFCFLPILFPRISLKNIPNGKPFQSSPPLERSPFQIADCRLQIFAGDLELFQRQILDLQSAILTWIFHALLSRNHEDGRATWQPQGVGAEAYLNGTSQGPTPEDARKDGHIIRARCAPLSPASGFPVSWSQQVIQEISGLNAKGRLPVLSPVSALQC